MCENPDDIPSIIDSNGKRSYAFVMYQMQTWLSYSKLFGTTKENIYNDDLQRTVTLYILNNGGWRHWYTCAKAITKKLGPYPMPGDTS